MRAADAAWVGMGSIAIALVACGQRGDDSARSVSVASPTGTVETSADAGDTHSEAGHDAEAPRPPAPPPPLCTHAPVAHSIDVVDTTEHWVGDQGGITPLANGVFAVEWLEGIDDRRAGLYASVIDPVTGPSAPELLYAFTLVPGGTPWSLFRRTPLGGLAFQMRAGWRFFGAGRWTRSATDALGAGATFDTMADAGNGMLLLVGGATSSDPRPPGAAFVRVETDEWSGPRFFPELAGQQTNVSATRIADGTDLVLLQSWSAGEVHTRVWPIAGSLTATDPSAPSPVQSSIGQSVLDDGTVIVAEVRDRGDGTGVGDIYASTWRIDTGWSAPLRVNEATAPTLTASVADKAGWHASLGAVGPDSAELVFATTSCPTALEGCAFQIVTRRGSRAGWGPIVPLGLPAAPLGELQIHDWPPPLCEVSAGRGVASAFMVRRDGAWSVPFTPLADPAVARWWDPTQPFFPEAIGPFTAWSLLLRPTGGLTAEPALLGAFDALGGHTSWRPLPDDWRLLPRDLGSACPAIDFDGAVILNPTCGSYTDHVGQPLLRLRSPDASLETLAAPAPGTAWLELGSTVGAQTADPTPTGSIYAVYEAEGLGGKARQRVLAWNRAGMMEEDVPMGTTIEVVASGDCGGAVLVSKHPSTGGGSLRLVVYR